MMLRSRLAAGLLALLSLIAGATHLYAQDGGSQQRPRVEVGLGGWVITQGETKWAHNASTIAGLGNPTSKLTYKDTGTNIVEGTVRFWVTPSWFGRLTAGYGAVGGGRLTDDDYLSVDGGAPSSRTFSDIKGDSTWYLNADVGRRVVEFPQSRGWLDLFAGYQYWYQRYSANGLGQASCSTAGQTLDLDPGSPGSQTLCSPTTTVSSSIQAITNTTQWHSIKIGASTEYRFTRRLSVLGTVALIPVSIVDNTDVHHLRPDLKQNPSISMVGYGIGADVDVGARYMFFRNFYANVGYRLWWNRTVDGTVTFHNAIGGSDEFPLTELQSFRHGVTFGISYSF